MLQIFKDHARSQEAKLQIALAEVPFVRYVICFYEEISNII